MRTPVPLGRSCTLCGEQLQLKVTSEARSYSDSLTALLKCHDTERVMIEAVCDCQSPCQTVLTGATLPPRE